MGACSVAKEDCTTIRGGGGARDPVATNVMLPAQQNPGRIASERRLSSPRQSLLRTKAHGGDGQLSLAGGSVGGDRPRVAGGGCGADPGQLCTAAEDGQAGRGAHTGSRRWK